MSNLTRSNRLSPGPRAADLAKCAVPVLLLFGQNLAVFARHYFQGAGFPWDFPMGYYALVAFWTSAVSNGVFPQWVPFQSMGYPLAMNLQTGLYYPPLWVFPLLRMPYTLSAAVVVQTVHVLFGSIGMFLFLRHRLRSVACSLIGAMMFQFFGGFYSNAEHVDIIRAFALTPWVLYVFTLESASSRRLSFRNWLIPLFIMLLATGGYPGNLLSCLFITGLYVLLQLADALRRGSPILTVLYRGGFLAGMTVLGLAMALPHLAPGWVERSWLTRSSQTHDLLRMGLWVEQLPGLFLTNKLLPGEISMTSTYVTLPAVILASLLPFSRLRSWWKELALGVVAVLMIACDKLLFFPLVTAVIPPLGLSRFPTSDYRVFVAIPLIGLAAASLEVALESKLLHRHSALRVAFVVAWLALGLGTCYRTAWDWHASLALAVAAATLLVVLFPWKRHGAKWVPVVGVVLLVAIDGARVLPDMPTWHVVDIAAWQNEYVALRDGGRFVPYEVFANLPPSRPPRTQAPHKHHFSWRGYLEGSYMMADIGNTILLSRQIVEETSLYEGYMLREWQPLFLQNQPIGGDPQEVTLSDRVIVDAVGSSTAPGEHLPVQQTFYGINDIGYQVSLSEPKLMVENETYFPGWTATANISGEEQELQAVQVNGAFRGWFLPAGTYELRAHFEFPYMRLYLGVGASACMIWFVAVTVVAYSQLRCYRWAKGCA